MLFLVILCFIFSSLQDECLGFCHSRYCKHRPNAFQNSQLHSLFLSNSLTNPTITLNAGIPTNELVKIFSRLADKSILLDVPGAGTPEMANCCHGGCDNCNFSHIFDEMSSARAKWIALYDYRELIDGRKHTPKWMQLFYSQEMLSKDEFILKINELSSQMVIGTPSVPEIDGRIDEQVLGRFWDFLIAMRREILEDYDSIATLDSKTFANLMKHLTSAEHGAMWNDFEKRLA